MKIGPGVRAAIVAGVTAGITVSLMLMGGHGSVTVHNTATDAPVDETTSTTVPDTTSTTLAPTTTTTVAPATTTTTLSLEQRLARLEATTTTTYPAVPPSINVSTGTLTPDGWSQTVMYYNHLEVAALYPNPVLHYAYTDDSGVVQHGQVAIPPQQDPHGYGTITVLVPGVTHNPSFTASNADVTWGKP